MAYNILYNIIKMDKYVVRDILNCLPEKEFLYTERTFECNEEGIYNYVPHNQHTLGYEEYYKAIYYDCIQNMYVFKNGDDEEESDSDEEEY
jgi:hypothetical protein